VPAEQVEATEMEDIHCSGAPTLEQYDHVRKVTVSRQSRVIYDSLLAILCLTTGIMAFYSFSEGIPFDNPLPLTSFWVSVLLVFWILLGRYRHRKLLQQMAVENRGLFAEGSWTMTERGISSSFKTRYSESSGITFWSGFTSLKVIDSIIILYYDSPDNSYDVFFKNWFASDSDWQRFLDLAERSVGTRESAGM